MGKRQREKDIAFQTHKSYFSEVASEQDILIIENVPEYSEKLVLQHLNTGKAQTWQLQSIRIDPRNLGFGCARSRVYMLAYRGDRMAWTKEFTLEELVDCLASRVVLSAGSYYWGKGEPSQLSDAEETWLQIVNSFFGNF